MDLAVSLLVLVYPGSYTHNLVASTTHLTMSDKAGKSITNTSTNTETNTSTSTSTVFTSTNTITNNNYASPPGYVLMSTSMMRRTDILVSSTTTGPSNLPKRTGYTTFKEVLGNKQDADHWT